MVPITATACNSLPSAVGWWVSLPSSQAPSPHADLPPCPFCQSLSSLPALLENCVPYNPVQASMTRGLSASFPPTVSALSFTSQTPQENSPHSRGRHNQPHLLLTEEELPRSIRFPHKVGTSIPVNKMLFKKKKTLNLSTVQTGSQKKPLNPSTVQSGSR